MLDKEERRNALIMVLNGYKNFNITKEEAINIIETIFETKNKTVYVYNNF